jgi:hypothetical protein
VAERAAVLAGRDDEFTMMVMIGYTGMRWGETIGLERALLLPALINVEWQLREIGGCFHRLAPKDDSYRSTKYEPLVPVDLPAFLADLLAVQAAKRAGQRCACAAHHGGSGRYVFPRPRRRPPPEQQLRAAGLPPSLRRTIPVGQWEVSHASRRGRDGLTRNPGGLLAASSARRAIRPSVRQGHPPADQH